MSPSMHDALKYGLIAVFVAALGAGIWVSSRMKRRASASGYWWLDLWRPFTAADGIDLLIYIAALLVGMAAIFGIVAAVAPFHQ